MPEEVKENPEEQSASDSEAKTEPSPKAMLREGLPAWAHQLPDAFLQDEKVKNIMATFPKLNDLAKGYLDLQQKIQTARQEREDEIARGEREPVPDASEYDLSGYVYILQAMEEQDPLLEGFLSSIPEGMIEKAQELAESGKLNPGQFHGMIQFILPHFMNEHRIKQGIRQDYINRCDEQLHEMWKGSYNENLAMAIRGIQKLANILGGDFEILRDNLRKQNRDFDPALINFAVRFAETTSEDSLTLGTPIRGTGKTLPKDPNKITDVPEGQEPTSLDDIYPSMSEGKKPKIQSTSDLLGLNE